MKYAHYNFVMAKPEVRLNGGKATRRIARANRLIAFNHHHLADEDNAGNDAEQCDAGQSLPTSTNQPALVGIIPSSCGGTRCAAGVDMPAEVGAHCRAYHSSAAPYIRGHPPSMKQVYLDFTRHETSFEGFAENGSCDGELRSRGLTTKESLEKPHAA